MRVRNSPEYKKRILALLEARKERRDKKIRERTQLELFEESQIPEIVLPDIVLLEEGKEAEEIVKRGETRVQAKKKKVK